MSRSRFEVFQDESGEYRWRLRAANGEIVAVGESYTRPEDAERACTTVTETAAGVEWVGPEGSAVCVERLESEPSAEVPEDAIGEVPENE